MLLPFTIILILWKWPLPQYRWQQPFLFHHPYFLIGDKTGNRRVPGIHKQGWCGQPGDNISPGWSQSISTIWEREGEEEVGSGDPTSLSWPIWKLSCDWSVDTKTNMADPTRVTKHLKIVHGLGTEVLHPPMTLQEWYHFVQGNDTNQNRDVPIDLLGMHFAIWAIFKMAAFENDENNKRSIYDCYWRIYCIIIVLSRFREYYKSE